MKFTKDDKMKYSVVKYTNSFFYGFNLVDKNERHAATKIVTDVDNDVTITGWRMSKKKPSWAISYQEWQSYISSGQNYHDGEIEASAVGNKEVESEEEASDSSSEDSDKSVKISDDYDSEAADASNDKKEGANNVCNWGQVIHCNHTQLPPLKCQKDGCNHLVHHLCQGNWEQSNPTQMHVIASAIIPTIRAMEMFFGMMMNF